jgi:chemotaxis protein methyltransferase CheR
LAFTYFFRDMQTLEMIRDHVIPALRTRRYIHIWDAGCAMGPEPYSIAIMLRENMGHMIFRNVKIHATDLDESGQFGNIIKEGVYAEDQLKRIPKKIFAKYFKQDGKPGYFRIAEEIRRSVSYHWHDLLSLEPIRIDLGLIICKNVMLHFKEQERINVTRMFHKALVDDGFFATEQTQKMPPQLAGMFEPVATHAQIFRKIS